MRAISSMFLVPSIAVLIVSTGFVTIVFEAVTAAQWII